MPVGCVACANTATRITVGPLNGIAAAFWCALVGGPGYAPGRRCMRQLHIWLCKEKVKRLRDLAHREELGEKNRDDLSEARIFRDWDMAWTWIVFLYSPRGPFAFEAMGI